MSDPTPFDGAGRHGRGPLQGSGRLPEVDVAAGTHDARVPDESAVVDESRVAVEDDAAGGSAAPQDAGRTEQPGPLAGQIFGAQLAVAQRYAELLAGDGVAHGHLGPRELPRLWTRHLLNCAVASDLVPAGAAVTDVGSGAGLPGLAIAIRRPDLRVTLVEPMERRSEFLQRCVDELALHDRVHVVRGRADEPVVRRTVGSARWVTARAVAPLDRLVRWCLPLLSGDGELLALKGRSAQDEVDRHAVLLRRLRAEVRSVTDLAVGSEVTRVVVVGRLGRRKGAGPVGERSDDRGAR